MNNADLITQRIGIFIYKCGGRFFYFAKASGLELDYVINYHGESTILDIKSKDGNAKSAKTVMAHPEHYGKTQLIQIKDSNLSLADNILTIPHYMAHILFERSSTLPAN